MTSWYIREAQPEGEAWPGPVNRREGAFSTFPSRVFEAATR